MGIAVAWSRITPEYSGYTGSVYHKKRGESVTPLNFCLCQVIGLAAHPEYHRADLVNPHNSIKKFPARYL
jgi:hypothetical protein